MAVKVNKKVVVEEEVSSLSKQEIEFILNIIDNSIIPGKYINLGNVVVQKLKNQYEMAGKSVIQVTSALKDYQQKKTAPPKKPKFEKRGEEVWIEE